MENISVPNNKINREIETYITENSWNDRVWFIHELYFIGCWGWKISISQTDSWLIEWRGNVAVTRDIVRHQARWTGCLKHKQWMTITLFKTHFIQMTLICKLDEFNSSIKIRLAINFTGSTTSLFLPNSRPQDLFISLFISPRTQH